jgi:hypothetical protein
LLQLERKKEQKQLLQKLKEQPTYLQMVYVLPLRNPGQGLSQSAVHSNCKVVKIMVRGHLNQRQKHHKLGQSGHLRDILSKPH